MPMIFRIGASTSISVRFFWLMDEHSDKDSTSTKIYWPKNGEIAYCFHQRWGILPVINMFGDVPSHFCFSRTWG